MLFCKCGALLKPVGGIMKCEDCGYSQEEGIIKDRRKKTKEVEVMEEEQESHPVGSADCGSCGNDKAFTWSLQTRSSDEPETQFFKCTKCKHTWREY